MTKIFGEDPDEKVCAYCGSNIPSAAIFCANCKLYTSRWRNYLPYLPGVVAAISVAAAAITFVVDHAPNWRKAISPAEHLELVKFDWSRLEANAVILNNGDDEVYVSDIWIDTSSDAIQYPVGILVEPSSLGAKRERLAKEDSPKPTGSLVTSRNGGVPPEVAAHYFGADLSRSCYAVHVFLADSADLREIQNATQGPVLNILATEEAHLKLTYFVVGNPIQQYAYFKGVATYYTIPGSTCFK